MGKQDAARKGPLTSGAGATGTPPVGGLHAARADRAAAAAADAPRERLLPPAFATAIVAAVTICLALMFPREPLRERLLGEGLHAGRSMDGATLDYLRAWLRVSPPDAALVAELAEQFAREGRLEDAETLLAGIDSSVTDEVALPMLRARLDVARQRANAAAADMPARQRYRSEQRTLLRQAAAMPAAPSDLIAFAAQARALGADDLEVAFYRALACPKPAHAALAGRRHPVAPVRSEWREARENPRRVRG
ncbi:hypothetical protein K7G19_04275 [Cupriavidus sp. DB3]|uniref:hypothetical protein n=1 Tax=Cupriavidus sp. DB3 TaxID=2873259 RepID=UPI001CF147C2|nr:hypothetical protein [Cupriavidus sp. DB3]MCA7082819.1 hypothetical protein [Cupriavidus sp. DB3]